MLKYTNIKGYYDKNHSLLHAWVLIGFVLFCFVIHLYYKKTEDSGPGQKKPSTASAIQQHQNPNENGKFLPELRTMKSQIALLKYFTHAHTLHLLNGMNQKKCESTYYVGMGKRVKESSSSKRNETLL